MIQSEKEFTLQYHNKIKRLQDKCEEGVMVYTKIPLSFALLNDLCFHELLLHPLSLSKHNNYERPDLSSDILKQTLEEIIIYEISQDINEGHLTSNQLHSVIKHFRTLSPRKLFA